MSVVAKRLNGLRCHFVWSKASVQATLCSVRTQLPRKRRAQPQPTFGGCLLWPNGWVHQEFKMPLDVEVNIGPGDVVSDGDPAPRAKGAQQSRLFLDHVSCGHGRPSQPLVSSCVTILKFKSINLLRSVVDFLCNLLQICCAFVCTTCCTTNPQQIEVTELKGPFTLRASTDFDVR